MVLESSSRRDEVAFKLFKDRGRVRAAVDLSMVADMLVTNGSRGPRMVPARLPMFSSAS